jgi:Ca2+-transporting ATPase
MDCADRSRARPVQHLRVAARAPLAHDDRMRAPAAVQRSESPGASPDVNQGLSEHEARERLRSAGSNELVAKRRRTVTAAIVEQVTSPLVLLLLGGSIVSAAVGHFVDAIAIGIIVSINAVVGLVQELRAERAVLALQRMTARRATVVRDGIAKVVPAAEIVDGDLLVLEPGDVVAADAEVVEAHNLSANEAVLTGESLPVEKTVGGTSDGAPLAERRGHVFMGTAVASGSGRAVVRAIAARSEMGRIADALAQQDPTRTPLQDRLAALGRTIVVACLGLVACVALLAWWRGFAWLDILLTSVSLAVAAVPEGLPAVVTIALAVGVHRMARHSVLVRRLAAVETLGSATVICTDKTGTLTTGVMEVRNVWGDRRRVLEAAVAVSDAELGIGGGGTGDAMELAILRAARADGIERAAIEAANRRVEVEPFDTATRRMSITRADGTIYVKGALEALRELGSVGTDDAEAALGEMAEEGLRVLAVAAGRPGQLELLGLIGFADPPRPEAIAAIREAARAGIRVIMITGDHPTTARAIAREMKLASTDAELDDAVVARATALDKLQIVRDLRARGEVVAMTGDGVNDAPSVAEADIGVAMGRSATEVTREAADMVLAKDDLSGIVEAIREGRVIYANIRKTVVYLLGGNSAELLLVIATTALGLPMPLLPLQLLWINLLGEPLPGIALSIDAPAGDVLDERPRPRSERLLGKREWLEIGIVAVMQAAIAFAAFAWALERYDVDTARTVGFSTLVFGVVFRALASRSPKFIYFEVDPRTNLRLLAVVALSAALQIAILYTPAAAALFGVVPLSLSLLALAVLLGLVPVTLVELSKLARRRVARDST